MVIVTSILPSGLVVAGDAVAGPMRADVQPGVVFGVVGAESAANPDPS
jgi:hypothetical protein